MHPISKITTTVLELMARPEGASVREVMDACGGQRKTVQACFQRRMDEGIAHVRAGVDGGGIRCHRYFSTKAAAEAYVFTPGYYDKRSEWKNAASAQYVKFVRENPALTYQQCAAGMGLTLSGVTKTLGKLHKKGTLFCARQTDMQKRRPVFVLFASEQERDEWVKANPYVRLGHSWGDADSPRIKAAPKPKAAPKVKVIREKLGSAKSLLSRPSRLSSATLDKIQARHFAMTVKQKPPEYELTSADLEKRVIVSGHPGYDMRYQCPPGERFIGGFSSMPLGSSLSGATV